MLGLEAFEDPLCIFVLFLGDVLLGFEVFFDALDLPAIKDEELALFIQDVFCQDDKEKR